MKLARFLRTFALAAVVLAIPAASFAGIFISVGIAPPPLPVYEQPPCPYDGYLWTPGYWAWSDDGGYYWVPGTWVQPPQVGFLWTPGYWAWNNGVYAFNEGYWGPHIGFYGGVDYGFGYGGSGYEGGYWDHGHFAYNRSVTNVTNVNVTNVYNKTVINNTNINNVNRTSFNGGAGGIQARPTQQEQVALRENHVQPTPVQIQHVNQAQSNPQLRASVNGGRPAIAATARPADFKSAVPARQAGGQVDTNVYKAAAQNRGKLPAGMKDPGQIPVNRAAATPETRPGATSNNPNPARPGSAPENGRPTPATRPTAANENARPAINNNHEVAPNQARPVTATRPPSTNQPEPAARPEPAPRPQQPAARPEPAPRPQQPAARPEPAPRPQQPAARPEPAPRPQQPAARPEPAPRPQAAPQPHEPAPHESHPQR